MNQELFNEFERLFLLKEEIVKIPIPDQKNITNIEEYQEATMVANSIQKRAKKLNDDYNKLIEKHGSVMMECYHELYKALIIEEYETCAKMRDKINELELVETRKKFSYDFKTLENI